jgi:hypothetical protein
MSIGGVAFAARTAKGIPGIAAAKAEDWARKLRRVMEVRLSIVTLARKQAGYESSP